MYWTRGLTISAEILFLAMVKPKTVKIILNNSPKCLSLWVTLDSFIICVNLSTPWLTKNYLSMPYSSRSFFQKYSLSIFLLATINSLSFSTFICSFLYLHYRKNTVCIWYLGFFWPRSFSTSIQIVPAWYAFVSRNHLSLRLFTHRSIGRLHWIITVVCH